MGQRKGWEKERYLEAPVSCRVDSLKKTTIHSKLKVEGDIWVCMFYVSDHPHVTLSEIF